MTVTGNEKETETTSEKLACGCGNLEHWGYKALETVPKWDYDLEEFEVFV